MDERLASLDILLRGAISALKTLRGRYPDRDIPEALAALNDARLIANNLRVDCLHIRDLLTGNPEAD